MLKFMMSAIGKTSGNIAYNRKLLKIKVKTLKNTCYGINFAKIAGKKNSVVLLKYEPFTVVSQRLINLDNKTLFFQSPCPGSGPWAFVLDYALPYINQVSKRWIKSFFVSIGSL